MISLMCIKNRVDLRLFAWSLIGETAIMTAKELKKLRRSDLLEMMLELRRENDALHAQVEELQRRLDDRRIVIADSGTLAEAALRLNGVFQAAQAACDQYMENMRIRMERQETTEPDGTSMEQEED